MDVEAGVVVGQKNVTFNEEFFQGHFPEAPIMPGVLMLEALAQASGVLIHIKDGRNRVGVLLNVSDAKFRRPVHPGDVLTLRCELLHFSSKGVKVKGQAIIDDRVAMEANLALALVERSQL